MKKSKRSSIKLISALVCIIPFSVMAAKQEKPNIVVFLIDDLGWADLGCYGSTFHETPRLDKLAQSGVRYTRSYSANPVCSPTRAALMTGKAPQRLGITQWIHQPSDLHLPAEETTLGEAFQTAGYATGYIGKWHLGEKDDQLPSSNGFNYMQCVNRAGQPASYFFPYKRKNKRGNYWDVPDLEKGKEGDYLTDATTDKALEFIEANKDKPFLLYFAHYTVHTPIQAPAKLVEKYKNKREKLYGESKTERLKDRYNTVSRGRQDNPAYAAMVESLDTNVGRVIDTLESLKLTDNTIIVFTSDNGGHCHLKGSPGATSNLPLRSGKGWTYEGGTRIPTIISWPGNIQAASSDTPTISMDLYPTLLDLAGLPLKPKQHLDGQSMKSDLLGKTAPSLSKRALYWTYPHKHGSGHKPSHAIQKNNWKLIHFDADNTNELYKIDQDLGEKNDVSGKNPEKVKALLKELNTWIKSTTP
ncbi:sulfatase [Verrucomicrobiaceae bacterium N1E253]|uniref:Sulfatase n=1 Tax=Oceaniferula marina TaxID=2748318 RepID=A0A851GHK9_9BACT|nr:sulfatase [Oceaniferula marina]NWK57013.1 sulfatase [Oceaniferula marina]